jgi:uncharacterized protein (TIGR03085 family)
MTAAPLDGLERARLCDLFDELGPDAPTLCEGWTTADLAAHLVVRENRPDTGPGILLGGPFASHTERVRQRAAQRPFRSLVDKVRNGPPLFWRVPGARTLLNLNEYFVHHEDVRRANGRPPRTDIDDLDDALWAQLRRGARLSLRGVRDVRVVLARPDGDEFVAKRAAGGDADAPTVRITGRPGELTLYLNGRKGAAEVSLDGPPDAVRVVADAPMGV